MNKLAKMVVSDLLDEILMLDFLEEGVYDPGIMKAIFVTGGPGAGKSSAILDIFGVPEGSITFSHAGLKLINSDTAFEILLKKTGYNSELSKLSSDEFKKITSYDDSNSIRSRASSIMRTRLNLYLKSKLGVIIDGTGHDYNSIHEKKEILEKLGYDTFLLFINTSLEKALERNRKRKRVLPDNVVENRWHAVQNNLGHFHSLFGNNMEIVDNNADKIISFDIFKEVKPKIDAFIKSPVKNNIGREWINAELRLKNQLKESKTLENKTKALIGVYSGRFQMFGKHHFQAYNQLRTVTGNNTYVATSNVTDNEKSPFTFLEKQVIISHYGIPKNNIVKVKNPYQPIEILKKYNAKTTALIVIFGEKDLGRLGGQGKYYLPYNENKGNLKGYEEHGYYIVARHESVKVAGKEISGTFIRKLLGSTRVDKTKKEKLFKEITGWFNKDIFEMVVDRLESMLREHVTVMGEGYIIKNSGINKNRKLLLCGGAMGHLSHPFDDMNLTFGDFKNIVRLALQGHLDKEAKVSEKLDGQALSISWKNGKLVAARNRGQLKNGGANALDSTGIKTMFANRGAITDAFGLAMDDLESAIKGLSEKQRTKIFQNGKNFASLEIIYPPTQNVIPYDTNLLVLHGVIEYDNSGVPITMNQEYGRMLAGMIRQTNKNIQKTFTISQPSFLTIPPHQDFSSKQKYFISKIDALKNKFKLKDGDVVSTYHQAYWEDFISKKAKSYRYAMPNSVLTKLVSRWAFNDTSNGIIDIGKMIDNKNFLDWVRTFDKEGHEKQVKDNMFSFEMLFLQLGNVVLKNATNFLAVNPNKTVQSIKKSIDATIKSIEGTHDLEKINKVSAELNKIEALGGMEAIVPLEGIVFSYGGKQFKFTGSFSPINKILGVLKYGN